MSLNIIGHCTNILEEMWFSSPPETSAEPYVYTLPETNSEFTPENWWQRETTSFWVNWPIFRISFTLIINLYNQRIKGYILYIYILIPYSYSMNQLVKVRTSTGSLEK